MDIEDRENQRKLDVITYIVCLMQSAVRFSQGLDPFDFADFNTSEFLLNKNMAFIEDGDIAYEQAHEAFLKGMFQAGWQLGPEDFAARIHPDLVPYSKLPQSAKELYAFSAAMVQSAKEFYASLRADLESEFMDSLSSMKLNWAGGKDELTA